MGFFSTFRIYVCSDMKGVVVKDGVPVEGVLVTRIADHCNDKIYKNTAVSDKDGKFEFKAIAIWSLRPIIFGTVIVQMITLQYQEQELLGLKMFKNNNHRGGEIIFDPVNSSDECIEVIFDLSKSDKEEKRVSIGPQKAKTYWGLGKLQH